MCFSVETSFGASLFLLGIGLLSFKNLKSKNLWPLAVVPLLFAAQQFLEGFVWLSKADIITDNIGIMAKYGFIFFAFIAWPFWIPFACWKTEENKKNKQILFYILFFGSFLSLILLFLIIYYGISVESTCNHLLYSVNSSANTKSIWQNIILSLYLIPTLAPFFISSRKNMPILGLIIFLTLALTMLFYYVFLISVWCFFAAIVSAFIYFIIKK